MTTQSHSTSADQGKNKKPETHTAPKGTDQKSSVSSGKDSHEKDKAGHMAKKPQPK